MPRRSHPTKAPRSAQIHSRHESGLPRRAVSCSCSVRERRPPPAPGRTPRPHHRRCVQGRRGPRAARVSRHSGPAAAVGAAETDVLPHRPPRRPRRRRHLAHHPARRAAPAAFPPAAGHPAAPPAQARRLAVPAGAGGLRLCLAIAAFAERAGHARPARRRPRHRTLAAPVLPHARRHPAKTAAPTHHAPPNRAEPHHAQPDRATSTAAPSARPVGRPARRRSAAQPAAPGAPGRRRKPTIATLDFAAPQHHTLVAPR